MSLYPSMIRHNSLRPIRLVVSLRYECRNNSKNNMKYIMFMFAYYANLEVMLKKIGFTINGKNE